MIRYIVFDTETTGLDPIGGDRIIEIGAVELIGTKITGKTYQQYINPEKVIGQETIDITHITNEMVNDKPVFKDIADDFINFLEEKVEDCEKNVLVAHNSSFDLKFLNHELKLIGYENLSRFEVIDTLEIARTKFPGQKATLDMLCEKFNISLEERRKEGHGALLDSKILADVFLKLTSGESNFLQMDDIIDFVGIKKRSEVLTPRKFVLTDEEVEKHNKLLQENNITI